VTLNVSSDVAKKSKIGEKAKLIDQKNRLIGIIEISEKYQVDYELELQLLYQPPRVNSTALELLKKRGEVALAGGIENNNLGGFSELNPQLQQFKFDND